MQRIRRTRRHDIDVLIPTCDRPSALAVALTSLLGQTHRPTRIVVSDQGGRPAARCAEVAAVARVLRLAGIPTEVHRHLPRLGLAEHREFLLSCAHAPRVLFLDDDVICEPDLLERLADALEREACGFVGSFVNAPSGVDSDAPADQPPPDAVLDLWDGPVVPERVSVDSPEWDRARVHFAAYHHRRVVELGIEKHESRVAKVAWVGACVLFDTAKLRECGGFSFWRDLPATHCGEDVIAQQRVMARYGGAGLVPSGAWHMEVPTTVPDREHDAPRVAPHLSELPTADNGAGPVGGAAQSLAAQSVPSPGSSVDASRSASGMTSPSSASN